MIDENMIERVARALYMVSAEPENGDAWEDIADKPWGDNYRLHARAAIEAMNLDTIPIVDMKDLG